MKGTVHMAQIIQLGRSARPRDQHPSPPADPVTSVKPIPPVDLYKIFSDPRYNIVEQLRLEQRRRAEFDKDLRIIGYGLAFAYAWVCIFRLAQIGGVL